MISRLRRTSRWAALGGRSGEPRCARVACACLVLLLLSGPPPSDGGTIQESGVLTVTVTGARNPSGRVGVALFSSREGFPEDFSKTARAEWATIDPATLRAEVTFRDVPFGSLAVSVLHDENKNGRLDRNLVGIPREGYGASNNAAKRRRAPVFDEAQFSFQTRTQTLEITLVY